MRCIPLNTNKYMSFTVPLKKMKKDDKCVTYSLKFIDSIRFMNDSLSNLVDNLSELYTCKCLDKKDQDIKIKYKEQKVLIYKNIIENNKEKQIHENKINKIVYTKCKSCNSKNKQSLHSLIKRFSNTYKLTYNNTDKFLLFLRKGVYPYEYMNDRNKFNENKLLSVNSFYFKLKLENINKEDYDHAKNVWDTFKIKNLGEYHDLYVQLDTTQFADAFENFRSVCLKEYELDPLYFVSIPGLALEAMLKLTNVKIELLTDIDMYLMVENAIRGGLTQVVKKYAVANNKYLPDYNKNIKSSYLQYLDANNLYGYAMIKKLPLDGFRWSDPNKYTSEFIKKYDYEIDNRGYLLEVDIEYPKYLNKAHEDLPFLCEIRKTLDKQFKYEISDDIKKKHYNVYRLLNITHESENRLIATIQDKKKYVVNISTLKQALDHGLILTKVHRVIEFNQSNQLKPYIDKNTELRAKAKNEFEKKFFKLINNSVSGKMIENVRKHRDIKLIVTEERRKKLAS